ncbi:MFS transporter [Streptomyces sp. NPDC048527]|uniref:MFS transporter n=1 Tax=Streptomyces sp. NPDC048527 TaxID=3365568 RepID=UPI00371DA0B8
MVADNAVRRWRRSLYVIFGWHGTLVGTWSSRIPWIIKQQHLEIQSFGLVAAGVGVGAVASMPLAARFSHTCSARVVVWWLVGIGVTGLTVTAWAPGVPVLLFGLAALGVCLGTLDVIANAEGVALERAHGRPIMPGLHAAWSVGAVLASVGGAWAADDHLDTRTHFTVVAAVFAATSVLASLGLPERTEHSDRTPLFRLPSRPTLTISLVAVGAEFASLAAADWSAEYLVRVTQAGAGVAVLAVTAALATGAITRLIGDGLAYRFGAVRVVRISGVVASLGCLVVASARTPVMGIAGFALVGAGTGLVLPLACAAAGRTSPNSAQSIASVFTVVWIASIVEPGLLGHVAELSSLPVAFVGVAVLCLVTAAGAGTLRLPTA